MTRLKLGMAGTGAFAARMAEAIASSPDVTLAGVASRDPVRAEGFAAKHGGDPYTDVAQMARAVDAVYVAGATARHEPDALAAIEAGTPVLAEKPMALDAAGTERVLAAAEAAGVLFVEGYWACHLPAWQAAKARLADGRIGQPRTLHADFGYATSAEDDPRVWSPDDGVLRDRGVYPVCLALWLYGPATLREARVTREGGVDTEATLVLDHENGAVSRLGCSLLRRTRNHAVLTGTEGGVTIREPLLGSQHVAGTADRTEGPGSQNALLRKAQGLLGQVRAEGHPYGDDQYHPQFAHLAGLVRDGATESPVVPHALSRGVARIIEEARASGTGGT